MRFYTGQHKYYCGVDLHTKTLFLCVLDQEGNVLLHRNTFADPKSFLQAVEPFRQDLAVAAECMFTWYWLSDLCVREGFSFVLGHALYMKAIHGGKTKNDRLDAQKIAVLLRGGMLPMAHVYPQEKRPARDLLRRRTYFVRRRADLLAHLQNTSWQYRLESLGRRISNRKGREDVIELFEDESVKASAAADIELIGYFDDVIRRLERRITHTACIEDRATYDLIRSVPGVGEVLTLIFLYEIDDVNRFGSVQEFCSYARLIRPPRTSAGKPSGMPSNKKIGNAHLKWAFSEAALLLMREAKPVKQYVERLSSRHNKGKALGILSHKLGRCLYYMLKRREPFNLQVFLKTT